MRDMYRRELERMHDTKCGQAAGTTRESKWRYFTAMSFVKKKNCNNSTTHTIKCTSGWGLSPWKHPNLEDDNASTNVSINDNDNDESSDGVSDERQVKKNLGTRRTIKFQEEVLNLQKMKIKHVEERPMKKSKADKDKKATCS